ncbi:hypothetical protein HH310_08525 [Actinoplanes sp. TBRC 11911]|uniref:beta strand repeat-containing protein n=1 Tax=Actinoplanes sp. TBRC 11911 TaxID=2729386 RepID=UPI00145CF054|nr:IPT/TIG domain-containing protein [Actinoplanes sp. TBRC 11911]NMO51230.1 hypothetical protein [Actinoplanes sp. TBRC 11911]
MLVAPQAAFAALTAPPTLAPAAGPIGTTVVATRAGSDTFPTTNGVMISTLQACPTYSTSATTTSVPIANPVKGNTDTTLTFAIPSSTVLTTGTAGAPKAHIICFYADVTAGTTATSSTMTTFTITPTVTLGTASGVSGGGNSINITATQPIFATVPGVLFSSGAASCPTAYPNPNSPAPYIPATSVAKTGTASTGLSVTVPSGVVGNVPPGAGATPTSAPYSVCFYTANTNAAAQIATSTTSYGAVLPGSTPATLSGPVVGTTGTTVTFSTNALINAASPGVAFTTANSCPGTYPNAGGGVVQAAAGAARKVANNRLAVTVPNLTNTGTYLMCVYNAAAANSGIVGAVTYTAVVVPRATAINPRTGSTLGGNTITVIGTDLPTTAGAITATIGGEPLTNITPLSDTAFTATTPAHAAGKDLPLILTTSAGVRILPAAFTYTNAITVTPNTSSNTTTNFDVSVGGVGFLSSSFDGSLPGSHVYLVNGVYNAAPSAYNANRKQRGPVAECTSVLVLSDNELICGMRLNSRLTEVGGTVDPASYISLAASDVTTYSSSKLITSPGGNFSVADIGQPITDLASATAKITLGTTIAAVLSPTTALMSANAASAGTAIATAIGGVPVAVTNPGSNGAVLTTASGLFGTGDANKTIVGPGIAANTVLLDPVTTATTATVTAAALTGTGDRAVLLGDAVPGVVTTNGSINVTAPDSSFGSGDVGRHIVGTGIQPGTTIVSIAAAGAGATLSTPATAGGTVLATIGGGAAPQVAPTVGTTNNTTGITAPALSLTLRDVGRGISAPTNIVGRTVAAVTTGGTVGTLSGNAAATGSVTATIAGGMIGGTAIASVTKTDGSTSLTAAASTFTVSDIGKSITGPGIPPGTTVTAVPFNGGGATISQPATGSGAVTVYTYTGIPVPEGAYNVVFVSNGKLDAAATDADYSQSAVSSASTFTVAAF